MLAVSKYLCHPQVLGSERPPETELARQRDRWEHLGRVGPALTRVRLVVRTDQAHQIRPAEAEVELIRTGSGQQKSVDAGSVEVHARNDRLKRRRAVEARNERDLKAERQVRDS